MPISTLWVISSWTDKHVTGATHLQTAKQQIKQNRKLTQGSIVPNPETSFWLRGLPNPSSNLARSMSASAFRETSQTLWRAGPLNRRGCFSTPTLRLSHQHGLGLILIPEVLLFCFSGDLTLVRLHTVPQFRDCTWFAGVALQHELTGQQPGSGRTMLPEKLSLRAYTHMYTRTHTPP